jgi:hypothetical protein
MGWEIFLVINLAVLIFSGYHYVRSDPGIKVSLDNGSIYFYLVLGIVDLLVFLSGAIFSLNVLAPTLEQWANWFPKYFWMAWGGTFGLCLSFITYKFLYFYDFDWSHVIWRSVFVGSIFSFALITFTKIVLNVNVLLSVLVR